MRFTSYSSVLGRSIYHRPIPCIAGGHLKLLLARSSQCCTCTTANRDDRPSILVECTRAPAGIHSTGDPIEIQQIGHQELLFPARDGTNS